MVFFGLPGVLILVNVLFSVVAVISYSFVILKKTTNGSEFRITQWGVSGFLCCKNINSLPASLKMGR
jgi:hypothetical protein